MRYQITLAGISSIIMHNGAAGLDKRSPAKLEIAHIVGSKKGSNRTEVDDARLMELECQNGLYLDAEGRPTLPAAALRAVIEGAARKSKQGAQVREGLLVESVDSFTYDVERYGKTAEDLGKSAQFTVPVVVQRARLLRTRPKFDTPWGVVATLDTDETLVDKSQLTAWLGIAGRRIGLGDWRPEKSGMYGRFEPVSVKEIE